jgi:hypothetical protein
MNDTGQDIRVTLLAGSDDVPPGIDLLRGVREQAAARRRHRRRARILVPAGAVAVAGGVAAAATLLGTSLTNPPSALAAVTSAMVKTSAQSYRFTMNGSLTHPSIRLTQHFALTGAIDPQHERGTELVTGGPLLGTHNYVTEQLRFIGKDLYTWVSPASGLGSVGKPWDEAPIPAPDTRASPGSQLRGNTFEQPISPAELLAVLRSAAAVRYAGPASGPGWTGSEYAFTAHPARFPALTVAGTVDVDQQGRVRSLDTITTWRTRFLNPGPTETEDLTFGDFGGPVQVTAPPASQVKQTTTPYWEFGF